MVDEVEDEFTLPGGRGSSADSIQALTTTNIAEFGKWLDSYSGKAKFIQDLKNGEEDGPLADWVEALCNTHDSEAMHLDWSDVDGKDNIVAVFRADKEVWKWLCTNAKE